MSVPMDIRLLVSEYAKYPVEYGEKLFQRIDCRMGASRKGAALDLTSGTAVSAWLLVASVT